MAKFVSLFRAINVGKRQVKMEALKQLHEALGLTNVSSYLQTGNILFETCEATSNNLAQTLTSEFEKMFGFYSAVMVRSAAELKELETKNPFAHQGEKQAKWYLVMFLADAPDKEICENLLSNYLGPEEIQIIGKEIYIYYTQGVGTSKLTNVLIEKKLKTVGTGRNWNTVAKLIALTNEIC